MAYQLTLILTCVCLVSGSRPRGSARPGPGNEDCALFRSNDTVALSSGNSTYLEIDNIDVGSKFSVSMYVLPSPLNHNGILLSIGTHPDFEYYEWKTKAIHTQFLVVEFIFSALALTVKANGTEHLQQIEVYRTWPKPYDIDDANWHFVQGWCEDMEHKAFRDRDNWNLKIDNLTVTRGISNKTDVQLRGKTVYIGGRPRYTDHQFQGVIRDLRINGKQIQMSVKKSSGSYVDVWRCNNTQTQMFMSWIRSTKMHA